jgi:hypothetical protein
LLNTLKSLRDLGNTVLVVEHDEATIRTADFIVDLGPGAGEKGGYLVAVGPPQEIMDSAESITGAYLSGRRQIFLPKGRRPGNGQAIQVRGAKANNLKDITNTPARTTSLAIEETIKVNNRHVKYLNFDDHGFSVLDLTPARAQMDWFIIGDRADPASGIAWTASFATNSGENKCHAVSGPVA